MAVTKHVSELCALIVDDMLGELPSRVITALLTKGRSTAAQIVRYTMLSLKHVKCGLAVLLQNNLLFYEECTPSGNPWYEVNTMACYNILRIGKVVDLVNAKYGENERKIVELLFQCGHMNVSALQAKLVTQGGTVMVGGEDGSLGASNGTFNEYATSADEIQISLQTLLSNDIIELVSSRSFKNLGSRPTVSLLHDIKTNGEFQDIKVDEKKQPLLGKRLREAEDAAASSPRKKRHLDNGQSTSVLNIGLVHKLKPDNIIRLNVERCLLSLRNQSLATVVRENMGDTTGVVYDCILDLITRKETSRHRACHEGEDEALDDNLEINTQEILDQLDPAVDLDSGIGKVSWDQIDLRSSQRVRKIADPATKDSYSSSSEVDGEEAGDRMRPEHTTSADRARGSRSTRTPQQASAKVTFDESVGQPDRNLEHLLLHLRLLAESRERFLRFCGKSNHGQWTVDLPQLLPRLRQAQIDAVVERWFGRQGLRVTRILREKGKMDEKNLMQTALMKKADVQAKLLAMQAAGIVEVQEVPRDSSRLANRTIFFWFCDSDRSRAHLLDDIYKVMVRCLQTLQVERNKNRSVLSFVDREDIRGKEAELMESEPFNRYQRHVDVQQKLLSQVMRLDDLVCILRDY